MEIQDPVRKVFSTKEIKSEVVSKITSFTKKSILDLQQTSSLKRKATSDCNEECFDDLLLSSDLTEETRAIIEADSKQRTINSKAKDSQKNASPSVDKDSDSELEMTRTKMKKTKAKQQFYNVKSLKRKPKQAKMNEHIVPIAEKLPGGNDNWNSKIPKEEFDEIVKSNTESITKKNQKKTSKTKTPTEEHMDKIIEADKAKPLPLQRLYYEIQSAKNDTDDMGTDRSIQGEFQSWIQKPKYLMTDLNFITNFLTSKDARKGVSVANRLDLDKVRNNIYEIRRSEMREMARSFNQSHERPCALGSECEASKLSGNPNIIGAEWLTPYEIIHVSETGQMPEQVRPCILCTLKIQMFQLITNESECSNIPTSWFTQTICFKVDVPSEYCLSQCIMSSRSHFTGFFYPLLIYCRNYWKVEKGRDGLTYFRDVGYLEPESDINFR